MCVLMSPGLQENVEVLQQDRVVHRAIMSYFTDYSPQLGRSAGFCFTFAMYANSCNPESLNTSLHSYS